MNGSASTTRSARTAAPGPPLPVKAHVYDPSAFLRRPARGASSAIVPAGSRPASRWAIWSAPPCTLKRSSEAP